MRRHTRPNFIFSTPAHNLPENSAASRSLAWENQIEMETRQLRRAAECAKTNRANSQHSTGPKTPEGKAASSETSFKHGLYSSQLVIPGEDPAALDALKADLRAEHQPATTTEELLVNEIAEHYWRIRRYRRIEAASLALPDELLVVALTEYFPLYQRFMCASERGLHKSLTALRQLQKDRGFVPHIAQAHSTDNCELSAELPTDNCELTTANCRGFVPHHTGNTPPAHSELKTAVGQLTTGKLRN